MLAILSRFWDKVTICQSLCSLPILPAGPANGFVYSLATKMIHSLTLCNTNYDIVWMAVYVSLMALLIRLYTHLQLIHHHDVYIFTHTYAYTIIFQLLHTCNNLLWPSMCNRLNISDDANCPGLLPMFCEYILTLLYK